MDIDLMFPTKFLKSGDLRGKDATLTVRRVIYEEVKNKRGAEKLWIIYFEETRKAAERAGNADMEKRLVGKVTICRQIVKATGERDSQNWVGKRITLYVTKTDSPQGNVDCIRVREEPPPAVTPAPPASVTEPEPATTTKES